MDVWKAGSEEHNLLEKVLDQWHLERLVDLKGKIAVVFREKATRPGGRVVQSKMRRSPQLLAVLEDSEVAFVVEIAADEWQKFSGDEKVALMDHHLCSIHVDENTAGERAYKIAPPDFIGYEGEIQRHGMWRNLNASSENAEEVLSQLFPTPPSDEE